MTQGKVWGKTQLIFTRNNVSVHRVQVAAGGFCSKHRHLAKYNLFFVESGRLRVTIYEDSRIDTDVGPGETTEVPPGRLHRFEALTDCIAYEIYWTILDENDIERHESGGTKNEL